MRIRPIEQADFPAVADLQAAAFAEDEIFHFLYPQLQDKLWTFRNDWLLRLRRRMLDPMRMGLVAEVDGEVVGSAVWAINSVAGISKEPRSALNCEYLSG